MCVVRFNVLRARVSSRKRYGRCGFSLVAAESVVVFVAVVVVGRCLPFGESFGI